MLLQRAGTGTIAPMGFLPPAWDILAKSWDTAPQPSTPAVTLGPETISMGHDDPEADDTSTDVAGHDFGWDNEHPKRDVHVGKFRIEWRPITNGEFYKFYHGAGKGKVQYPASWVEHDGETMVCFVF
jgi:L-histidine Nalpha-methyltransferase / hercynylcysteine S-oxide synthase